MISDGTANEEERLGAQGDLQLALRRLDRGGDVLVAATDKLLAFELAEPLRFARAAPVTLCVRMPDRRHLAGRHGCVISIPSARAETRPIGTTRESRYRRLQIHAPL